MINKQNLWFVTLFSLIMVLSIYYLSLGDDKLATLNVKESNKNETAQVVTNENETLVALKVASEEELITKIEELQNTLLNETATLEEKNDAYEKLQSINKDEGNKETIQKLIKETYKLESFVSINGTNINVTIGSTKHDTKLANNIIRSIQELYTENMYITVKFS